MLLGQYRGRHQYRHLFPILNRLKCRTESYFRLSKANITADQPIHGHTLLHVRLDLADSAELIISLHEGKGCLQFTLPFTITTEGVTTLHVALGVELEQFLSHILHRSTRFAFCSLPLLRS